MKVIDLLNKIANEEEVPKKLLYKHEGFVFDNEWLDYLGNLSNNWLFEDYSISAIINDEVEIIEEDKKIEKIKDKYCSQISKVELAQKINEIIDKINKEK